MGRRQQFEHPRWLRGATLATLAVIASGPVGGGRASAAEPLLLTTPDGRQVRLCDDFTWEYVQGERRP